jgi:RNA polymerase sigma-70 factor (ECF subfamily)
MAGDANLERPPDPLATFNEYPSVLFPIAYRMLAIVADAEDVLQNAFIRWQQAAHDACGGIRCAS